jgi:hypothetical protein
MRKVVHLTIALLATAAIPVVIPTLTVEARAAETAVQSDAVDALTRMGAYLRTLKNFKLTADTVFDNFLDNGQKIRISGQTKYQVRTPDKLTLEVNTDKQHRFYYYDGKTVTQYAPETNMYAVFDAPDTIGKTIDRAQKRYGLSLPIADLFYAGLDEEKLKAIRSAVLVGESTLDGHVCNHYAYRLPRVDFEIWIRKDGDPLPCELLITDTTDPARSQNGAVIRIEDNANLQDSIFTFAPPADAQKIEIEPVKGASADSN